MAKDLNQFLGGTPFRIVIRLLLLSLVVGVVLDILDLHPMRIWEWARDFAFYVWDSGIMAFERVGGYLAMGALVVVPIFLISRLMKSAR